MASIKQAEQKVELRTRKWKEAQEKHQKALQSLQDAASNLFLAQGELIAAHQGQGSGGGKVGKSNGGTGDKGGQKKAMAGGPREEESELD